MCIRDRFGDAFRPQRSQRLLHLRGGGAGELPQFDVTDDKSKGLEFPIVIVSGMGKNFNKQDTQSKMVLHPELGIGLDYMDGKKRIKSPTIAKKAIAKQIELENLGEELRVLYVALTRAKEKLILTGTLKDAAEKLEFYRQQANLSKAADRPLSYLTREGASGYLDWILPAVLSYGDKYRCV